MSTTRMRCQKIYNTDALQSLKLARNLHRNSRILHENSSTIYTHADTMGQENKIQSRHISTDTVCLLRTDKRTSHVCHNKNTQQMSGGRLATITITMTLTTATMAGNVAGAAMGERGGRAGAAAEATSAFSLENGNDNVVVVD